jgi:hypothetical protein
MLHQNVKKEWWYEDSLFYPEQEKIWLALLKVYPDGAAEIVTDNGNTQLLFDSEDEANSWLVDEEFRFLEDLVEDLVVDGNPIVSQIVLPMGTTPEELKNKMILQVRKF